MSMPIPSALASSCRFRKSKNLVYLGKHELCGTQPLVIFLGGSEKEKLETQWLKMRMFQTR